VPEGYDRRPEETLDALLHRETRDETWNACQKPYLIDGWMHNALRMYWATACSLNDRPSFDGRDPATYGNLASAFAAPSYRDLPIYGWVSTSPTAPSGSTERTCLYRSGCCEAGHPLVRPSGRPSDPYHTASDLGRLPTCHRARLERPVAPFWPRSARRGLRVSLAYLTGPVGLP
jgi:deoxyribodipyrimidine photo-lyase